MLDVVAALRLQASERPEHISRLTLTACADRVERLVKTMEFIARGDVPPDQHGHYLAHRTAVKLARAALSQHNPDTGQ